MAECFLWVDAEFNGGIGPILAHLFTPRQENLNKRSERSLFCIARDPQNGYMFFFFLSLSFSLLSTCLFLGASVLLIVAGDSHMPQERINISLSADGHTGRASRPSSTRSLARSLNALTNPTHVTLQSSLSLSHSRSGK